MTECAAMIVLLAIPIASGDESIPNSAWEHSPVIASSANRIPGSEVCDLLLKMPHLYVVYKVKRIEHRRILDTLRQISAFDLKAIRQGIVAYAQTSPYVRHDLECFKVFVLNRYVFDLPKSRRRGDFAFFYPRKDKDSARYWPWKINGEHLELVGAYEQSARVFKPMADFDALALQYPRRQLIGSTMHGRPSSGSAD